MAELCGPAEITMDDWSLLAGTQTARVATVQHDGGQVVIRVQNHWVDPQDAEREIDGSLEHTFYSDGVLVTRVELVPAKDLVVRYGGRYRAAMDPYCDMLATCLASPNGLAEYRLESDSRMLDRYPVDGMYIDDNFALSGCQLPAEHGHPRPGYDCLDDPALVVTETPGFRATAYRNEIWNDVLVAVANLGGTDGATTLQFPRPRELGLATQDSYWITDGATRDTRSVAPEELAEGIPNVTVGAMSCRLLVLRRQPSTPHHVCGGKRLAESWNPAGGELTLELDGPVGLEESVLIATAGRNVSRVLVRGVATNCKAAVEAAVVRVPVCFRNGPIQVEITLDSGAALPPSSPYRWVKVTDQAPFAPRDGAGAVVFADKLWLLGGWNPMDKATFPQTCISDVWNSVDGVKWTRLPDAPWEGRHTAGYVVHDGKIWIVGGDAIQRHYQDDVWNSSDGVHWNCVTNEVPWKARVLHYTVAHDGRIWVIGGQSLPQFAPGDEVFYNDVWSSRDGLNWELVTPHAPWSPRGMIGGSVAWRDRIWLIGGGTYDTPQHPQRQFFGEVWSSADGKDWRCAATRVPWHPRQYHETAAFDDRLWVLEGWNQENRNDVWYSEDGALWHELPRTPWAPRHAASVFVYNNALWLVAGNHFGRDVWKLEQKR